MAITVEAVYENGVLRPSKALPLRENEQVSLTVQTAVDLQARLEAVERGYGLLRWTGSLEDLDYLIGSVENDPLEGP